ncbi:hypothetical protein ACJD0Z_02510 [Flavobacteriaceae bacterium M23B6Z8]
MKNLKSYFLLTGLIFSLQLSSQELITTGNDDPTVLSPVLDTLKKPGKFSEFLKEIRWSVDILAFGRTNDFAEEPGTLNPENRVAELRAYDGGLYVRPELKYTNSKLGIYIKPRLNIDINAANGSFFAEENYEDEFFFQELKLRWYLNQSVAITAGRYLKTIGSSVFINPSNPFFIDPGRLNPKFEIRPMDFIEFNYSKSNWAFSLIANIHEGLSPTFEQPFFEFERRYAILAEYYGSAENIGALFSIDESERIHFGYFGQKNISEAVVAWIDGSLEYKPNRFYPERGHSTGLIGYDMVNGSANEKLFATALIGASYTLKIGPTLQLEYFYNGKGYTDSEFELFQEMIAASVDYNFDVTQLLSDRNLGRGINPGMPYLRRHYLFSQVGQNDLFSQLNFNVRYFYSLEDQSSQVSSLIEWNVMPSLELHTVLLKNFGGRDTDFNRFLDHQYMFGFIYKF